MVEAGVNKFNMKTLATMRGWVAFKVGSRVRQDMSPYGATVEPAGRGGVNVERNERAPIRARRFRSAGLPAVGAVDAACPRWLGASAHVSSGAKAIIVTAVLFSPILAEVVRKYVVWSNSVFTVHYALIVVFLSLFLLKDTVQLRLVPQNLFTAACLVVAWVCLQAPLTGVSPLALLIGISTYVIPVVALYLSVIAFATTARLAVYSFSMATAILIVSYGLGILQIASGPDTAFNYMPPGVENEIAGYAIAADSGLEIGFMVRPASIYMHTGKFGSIVAVLSLFRLFYMYSANYSLARIIAQVLAVDLPAIVVSGQRAAALVYLAALFVVLVKRGDVVSWILLLGGIVVLFVGSAAGLVPSSALPFGGVAVDRIASGLDEIPWRLQANVLRPATGVLERYLVIGEGPGMFSSGLRNFAEPDHVLEHVFLVTENGWLRMAAELGVIGMLLYGLMLWSLFAAGIRLSGRFFNYLTVFCLALALWSNTHDLFNNYVMMWQGFLLAGIVLLRSPRQSPRSIHG
jgi:hypothetical protein